MSGNPNNPAKLAFSSQCVPGSPAELQEAERLAEFQRLKAIRKAEEELGKPEAAAKRDKEFTAACEANKERMNKKRAGYATYTPYRDTTQS